MSVETQYTVSGMTCDHCVRTVTSVLGELPGVEGVKVDLASGRVDVHSQEQLDRDGVAQALDEAGYPLAGE